jgi:hypothetical protein
MSQHIKISWVQSTDVVDYYCVYLKESGTSITPGYTSYDAKINKGDLGELLSWSEGNIPAGQKRIVVSRYSSVTGYHTVFDITKDIPAGQTGEFTVPSSERVPDEITSISAEEPAQSPEQASSITVSYSPASPGSISLEHSPNTPASVQSQADASPAQPSLINVDSSPAQPVSIAIDSSPAQPSLITAEEPPSNAYHWGKHIYQGAVVNSYTSQVVETNSESVPYTWYENAFSLNSSLSIDTDKARFKRDRLQSFEGTFILFENGKLYFRYLEYDSTGSSTYGPSGNSLPWTEELREVDDDVITYAHDGDEVYYVKNDGSLWYGDISLGESNGLLSDWLNWAPTQEFASGQVADVKTTTFGVVALKKDGTLIGKGYVHRDNKYMFGGSPGSAYDTAVTSSNGATYTSWITDDPIDTNVLEFDLTLTNTSYIKQHPVTGVRCLYFSGIDKANLIDPSTTTTRYHRQRVYLEGEYVDGTRPLYNHANDIAPPIRMIRCNRHTVTFAYDEQPNANNPSLTSIGYFGGDGTSSGSSIQVNSGSQWPFTPRPLYPGAADTLGTSGGPFVTSINSVDYDYWQTNGQPQNTQNIGHRVLKDYSLTDTAVYSFTDTGRVFYGGRGYLPTDRNGNQGEFTDHPHGISYQWIQDPPFNKVVGKGAHSIGFNEPPGIPKAPTISALTVPVIPSVITADISPPDPASITVELDPLGTPVVSVSAGAVYTNPTTSLPASFTWPAAAGATHYTYTYTVYSWNSANNYGSSNLGGTYNSPVTINTNDPLEYVLTQSLINTFTLTANTDGFIFKLRLKAVNASGHTSVTTDIFYKVP